MPARLHSPVGSAPEQEERGIDDGANLFINGQRSDLLFRSPRQRRFLFDGTEWSGEPVTSSRS
jgi:hypothetical protein